jgi:hypothetical protein
MEGFRPNQYEGEAPSKRPDIVSGYRDLASRPKTKEAHEAIEKVRTILESIDEPTLFEIFQEYFGKVGNDIVSLSKTITPIKKVVLVFDKEKRTYLGWNNAQHGTVLNAATLDPKNSDQVINTLIHEYLHEITRQAPFFRLTTLQDKSGGIKKYMGTGLSSRTYTFKYDRSNEKLGDFVQEVVYDENVNEGVTQIVTDDIHAEYAKRVGEGNNSYERKMRVQNEFSSSAYMPEQLNIRLYIAIVSALTSIPEDDVKNSVVRCYFRNGQIVPDEIADHIPGIRLQPELLVSHLGAMLASKNFVKNINNFLIDDLLLDNEQRLKLLDRIIEIYGSKYLSRVLNIN